MCFLRKLRGGGEKKGKTVIRLFPAAEREKRRTSGDIFSQLRAYRVGGGNSAPYECVSPSLKRRGGKRKTKPLSSLHCKRKETQGVESLVVSMLRCIGEKKGKKEGEGGRVHYTTKKEKKGGESSMVLVIFAEEEKKRRKVESFFSIIFGLSARENVEKLLLLICLHLSIEEGRRGGEEMTFL